MNGDIYDSGMPKYSTAQSIYDALCELVQTEEMGRLGLADTAIKAIDAP